MKPDLNFHLSTESVREIRKEAARLGRSMSWVAQRAWELSRSRIREIPGDSYGNNYGKRRNGHGKRR